MQYRFKTDNEGNWYLIDLQLEEKFREWDENQNELWNSDLTDEEFETKKAEYQGPDFNDKRIDTPEHYTVEMPFEE